MTGPVFGGDAPVECSLGATLLNLRNLSGLSQRELAKRAGLTNSVISTIEQGKVSPSVSSLAKLLSGMGLSLAQFYSLNDHHQGGAAPAREVSQRSLFLAAGAKTQLMLSATGGVSIACSKGDVSVRTLSLSRALSPGESLVVPAGCAYVLENVGVGEVALWSASMSV